MHTSDKLGVPTIPSLGWIIYCNDWHNSGILYLHLPVYFKWYNLGTAKWRRYIGQGMRERGRTFPGKPPSMCSPTCELSEPCNSEFFVEAPFHRCGWLNQRSLLNSSVSSLLPSLKGWGGAESSNPLIISLVPLATSPHSEAIWGPTKSHLIRFVMSNTRHPSVTSEIPRVLGALLPPTVAEDQICICIISRYHRLQLWGESRPAPQEMFMLRGP